MSNFVSSSAARFSAGLLLVLSFALLLSSILLIHGIKIVSWIMNYKINFHWKKSFYHRNHRRKSFHSWPCWLSRLGWQVSLQYSNSKKAPFSPRWPWSLCSFISLSALTHCTNHLTDLSMDIATLNRIRSSKHAQVASYKTN